MKRGGKDCDREMEVKDLLKVLHAGFFYCSVFLNFCDIERDMLEQTKRNSSTGSGRLSEKIFKKPQLCPKFDSIGGKRST